MKKIFGMAVYLIAVFLAFSAIFNGQPEGLIYGILIFTAPGGVGANFQFNMNYLPEKITWNDGGNPLNFLRVETQEDGVLHNWTAAAIAALDGFMNVGAQAANQVQMIIADGHIKNKNVTISGQTSAVGAINIFVSSDNLGVSPFKTAESNILANNDTEFTKFSALFLPNIVTANDRVQVFYKDNHVQTYDAVELLAWSSMYQEVQAQIVNNLMGNVDKVIVTSAAGGLAYVLSVKIG